MTNQKYRHVAFLDVLGFSDLIFQNPTEFDHKFDAYISTIGAAIGEIDPTFEYKVFSDTILILSESDSFEDLLALVEIISIILFELTTNQKIPVKGSISTGNILEMSEKGDSILAGKAIIEAYNYEQLQNWLGVILGPSVINKFDQLEEIVLGRIRFESEEKVEFILKNRQLVTSLIYYEKIPLKDNSTSFPDLIKPNEWNYFSGIAIVPHQMTSIYPELVSEDLINYLKTLNILLLQGKSISIQSKYRATIEFIKWYISSASYLRHVNFWLQKVWELDGSNQRNVSPRRPEKASNLE